MAGIESYSSSYCHDLAASDYLVTQLIYGNEKGQLTAKIQGAIKPVLFVGNDTDRLTWQKLMTYARDPAIQFATINAPEGAYGTVYEGGEFAEPISESLKQDMHFGSVCSDAAKWTAFARERHAADLPFALVSCTNFSDNGDYTGATLRAVARAWERRGLAPDGFTDYLSDPIRFAFPNTMIDRIAVPSDEQTEAAMQTFGLVSHVVVTEHTRYWVVEDVFPAGRPPFERARGVIMARNHAEVKRYEDMKLRLLNMAQSVIGGLGVLLGYRGPYGICRAMQDRDLRPLILRIMDIVIRTVDRPAQMDPADFARETVDRLDNPNIPDDPMRIALNGSTKLVPRFLGTYFAACSKGLSQVELDLVLLSVAGFLRYTLGIDDQGNPFDLEQDPIRDILLTCGRRAKFGNPDSAAAFIELIRRSDLMGRDLTTHGNTGIRLVGMVAQMLAGQGAVRKLVSYSLSSEKQGLEIRDGTPGSHCRCCGEITVRLP